MTWQIPARFATPTPAPAPSRGVGKKDGAELRGLTAQLLELRVSSTSRTMRVSFQSAWANVVDSTTCGIASGYGLLLRYAGPFSFRNQLFTFLQREQLLARAFVTQFAAAS